MRWLDRRFDRAYGTDTAAEVDSEKYSVTPELMLHAVSYSASPDRLFRSLLRQQRLDFSNYTFIDLGCGKGRTLLLASQFAFRKIVGVEMELALVETCRRNIGLYMKCAMPASSIEVLHMSAGNYEFPSGNIFLYLFNPFDEHIMSQVVAKLLSAITSEPRIVRVLYLHPNHVTSLLTLPNIRLVEKRSFYDRKSIHNLGRVATYEIAPRKTRSPY